MSQIIFDRLSGVQGGMARKLTVKVDDEIVATLRPGERRSVEISAGRHVVQAKMDWCTSPQLPIDVAGDEGLTVEVMFPFNLKSLFKAYVQPRTSIVVRAVTSPEL